jgi:hypothetical protein
MSKWVVEMKKLCNFCQGAKGYCGYYDIIRGHSCAGDLTRRPEWCPVTPLDVSNVEGGINE